MHEPGDDDPGTRALDETAARNLTTVEGDRTPLTPPDPISPLETDGADEVGAMSPPRVGQVFFNRYVVDRQIGEGGMGTVWLVRHLELDAPRALKLIISGIAFDPQMRARFRREARAMAKLSHPNAVAVHDARIGRDSAFIEMEYIRGESLNKVMTPGVPMPLDWVSRIVEQLCDVLQEAHDQKIVHRDLKPSNMMLVADRPRGKELLKVLDFGIAKILGADNEASDVHTGTGCFLGSAPWSSPEQIGGGDVDARSDLYSVGIILYELLTGSRPFTGPFVRQVYDHVHTPAPRFATINPNVSVPPALEQVVLRCLAKRPEDRPQTASDLAAEFLWAASDRDGTPSFLESSRSTQGPPPDLNRTQGIFQSSMPAGPFDLRSSPMAPTAGPDTQPATEAQTMQIAALGQYPALPSTQAAPIDARVPIGKYFDPNADGVQWPTEATTSPLTEIGGKPWSRRRKVRTAVIGVGVVAGALAMAGLVNLSAGSVPEGYRAEGQSPGDRLPVALVRERDNVRFIRIKGGTFVMGNGFDSKETASASAADKAQPAHPVTPEAQPTQPVTPEDRPAHPVTLSDYYLQATEVTNGELDAYFTDRGIDNTRRPERFQNAWRVVKEAGRNPELYPAVGVEYALAEAYAAWVGGKLPTEAQWEYAARSRGLDRPYVWADDRKPDDTRANIDSLGQHARIDTSVPGDFTHDRTDQGILDMTGNVREWCRDRWGPYKSSKEPLQDPVGPVVPGKVRPLDRVVRGGSYLTWNDFFRTTRPRRIEPKEISGEELEAYGSADDLGFRVVIEWPRNP